MPVLNDEVPSEGDYDADRPRGGDGYGGDFGDAGGEGGEPPRWLADDDLSRMRASTPVPYVVVVPVRTDETGRVRQVGTLLAVDDGGAVTRTLVAGRILFHETIRSAIARNVAHDLGDIALPIVPASPAPFMVAEFFPTPGVSEYFDPRQHAIGLCYVVPIAGDCTARDETLDVEWVDPARAMTPDFGAQVSSGCGRIIQTALVWAGAI